MLSPHEFATLMLVKDAARQSEFDPLDLQTLVDQQLINLGEPAPGLIQPRVTDRGYAVLNAFTQVS